MNINNKVDKKQYLTYKLSLRSHSLSELKYCIRLLKKWISLITYILSFSLSSKINDSKKDFGYKISYLPKKKKLISVIRSPHVHKKGQDQFHLFSYKSIVILRIKLTGDSYTDSIINLLVQGIHKVRHRTTVEIKEIHKIEFKNT